MNKLQAAMKDKSARNWNERKHYYRVGSCFKGCAFCGEYDEETSESGRIKRRYTSGLQVYRSYYPARLGWTYMCWDCSAKDSQCWENAADIGTDAIVGTRDSVKNRKAEMRKHAVRNESTTATRSGKIEQLEAELARLMEMLKKGRS